MQFAKLTRLVGIRISLDGVSAGDKKPWNKLFQESITTNSIDHLKINSIHMKARLTETETETEPEQQSVL